MVGATHTKKPFKEIIAKNVFEEKLIQESQQTSSSINAERSIPVHSQAVVSQRKRENLGSSKRKTTPPVQGGHSFNNRRPVTGDNGNQKGVE